ncbi:MAG: TetR/AcrR family transcriptional regulator [Limnothrix sp. CACIAM 69d]|nr:MAG: TetR/AcrR family transcriptional regulator [Limnothrix sp. CACIAM 69d]
MTMFVPAAHPIAPLSKKRQILDGAMKTFLVKGYAGTSMDRVAATAGVSKATVYSHFQNKESLFGALVEELARSKFPEMFDETLLGADPHHFLRHLANLFIFKVGQDEGHMAFIRLIMAESERFPELSELFIRNFCQRGCEALTSYLAAHPELNIDDPEATARVFIGALAHFNITQEMLGGKHLVPMDPQRVIDTLLAMILRNP